MHITVRFFSQLKEIVGEGALAIDMAENATVTELLAEIYRRCPALENWDRNILVGAGVEFVGRDYVIQPNDKIAIMPPVQGG